MTRALLAGLLVLAGASGALAGPSMSSETNLLPRQSVDGGGQTSATGSNRLHGAAGEAAGASASTNFALRAGALEVFSFPRAVTDLAGAAALSSATLSWSAPGADGHLGALQAGSSYYIRVASYTVPDTFSSFSYANVVVSTSGVAPGQAVSTTGIAGLLPNTTWFASLWTSDPRGGASFQTVDRATFTTLALPPNHLGSEQATFLEVHFTSVTAAWGALPVSPPAASSETAQGYVLEASSTNFGALEPGGVVSSTTTFEVAMSTLTVLEPALIVNRLYYFRVGSRNHRGELNYLFLGSTMTKLQANPPGLAEPTYLAVASHSITAQWDRNGNASDAYYRLEASLSSDFSVFKSSVETYNLYAATDTLSANTTYYFQVRATTRTSSSEFTSLGSTVTLTPKPALAASTFIAVNPSSMTVSWDGNGNPPGVSTYTVVLTTAPAEPHGAAGDVVLSTRPAGASPFATLTGLAANTTYYLYADGRNWLGASSGWTALGSTVTLPAEPAPASPFVLETSYSSMTVSWSAAGNAVDVTTYTVVFSTGEAYPNALPGNVELTTAPAGAVLAATGQGLLLNATYYVHARAVGHSGAVTPFVLLGSTATRGVPPVQASPPYEALSATSYRVHWSSGTEAAGFNWGGTTYYVQASTSAAFFPVAVQVEQIGGLSADLSGLSPNTTYEFRVAAFNVFSGTWTAFTAYPSTSTLASTPASVLAAVVEKTSATVTWASSDPVGVTTFTVVLSPESSYPNSNPSNVSVQKPAAGALSSLLTGLAPNTTYYPHVAAANHQGALTPYSVGAATSTRALEPSSPATASVHLSSVVVSWMDVDAAGYELQASSTNFGALLPGGPVHFSSTTNGNATSLAATGLWSNTTYYLRLASYNHNDHPSRLEISSAATLAVPVTGADFKTVHETSATLTWHDLSAFPSSASAGGYRVDAATADAFGAGDFGGVLITSVTYLVGLSTLTVEGLEPGTTYVFRIASLNHAGEPNFAAAGSTRTSVSPFTWVGGGGNTNWYNAANWSPRGVPSSGSPVTIAAADVSVTVSASSPSISFSSLTLGSPSGSARVNLFLSTSIARGGDVLIHPGAGLVVDSTQTLRIDGDWTMMAGSSLTHTENAALPLSKGIDLSVTGTFDLRANAVVDVTTRGYAGGVTNGGTGQGPGPGTGDAATSSGGGGGAHGGDGGDNSTNLGGVAYDSGVDPAEAGSGGGGGDFNLGTNTGGAGGGYVRVSAGTIILDGLIRADAGAGGAGQSGSAARAAGGGGGGGAVALYAGQFSGSGTLQARGGAGGADTDAGDEGGGGGGGIVAVDISGGGNVCSLTVTVTGGASGGGASQAGFDGVYSSTPTLGRPELSAAYVGSDTIKWAWTPGLGAQSYRLYASTGGAGNSPSLSAATLEYYERGLMPNTTYERYIEASACGASTRTLVQAYSTLASTVAAPADAFLQVEETFVTAAWVGFPASPQEATSEGYVLEASPSADFSSGVVSSTTYNAAASTLTVSGLARNTTYYFRAASLNWQAVKSSYTSLGAASTLALPPQAAADSVLAVHFDSATARWHRFYASDPQELRSEGFVLEASTTNFGALSPGGAVVSSATADVAVSTLTLDGLDLAATYYFRVASLSHDSRPNYTALDRLNFQIFPSLVSLDLGSLDAGVVQSTVSTTVFELRNVGNYPATFNVWAATDTAGSAWSLGTVPGNEVPVLQGLFNAAQPAHAAFSEAITVSTRAAAAFSGDQTGVLVPPGESRRVWFRLQLPTSTATGAQRLRVEFRPTYQAP